MKVKDIDALREQISKDPREAFTKHQVWLFASEHNKTVPTVEAIPREEVRQFIENIQKIKDNHNEYGEPINYGTICGILIEGYRLLDKYREGKDGNDG